MSKNIIPQIAEMLGIVLEEEFKVSIAEKDAIFRITENGLEIKNQDSSDSVEGINQEWKTIPSRAIPSRSTTFLLLTSASPASDPPQWA